MKPTELDAKLYSLGFQPSAYYDTENTNGTLLVDSQYVETELPHLIGKTMLPWYSADWIYSKLKEISATNGEYWEFSTLEGHNDPLRGSLLTKLRWAIKSGLISINNKKS